ncbi:armadillo-type protein [Pseudomassariella vexata]|uniref:Armadillo-type protein n=1 Tax=Pseudomassariella vexata TaxID=1141098 RepID=A0A1Y2DY81_9PEZI|nr:armadillo-type protein [Pseudomassariella vexata]ORY64197.1 armadillo-type protein [Pseudomassariella vexata]
MKLNHEPSTASALSDSNPMDKLLAKLSEQQAVLNKQNEAFKSSEDGGVYRAAAMEHNSSSASMPITPATETFGTTAPTTRPASAAVNDGQVSNDEVLRLKLELAQAQNKISRLEEMSQTHQPKSEFEVGYQSDQGPPRIPGLFNGGSRSAPRDPGNNWYDDSRSDTSEALSASGFNRARNIWDNGKGPQTSFPPAGLPAPDVPQGPTSWGGRGRYADPSIPYAASDGYKSERLTPDYDMTIRAPNRRGGRYNNDSRYGHPAFGHHPPYSGGYNNYNPVQFDGGNGSLAAPGHYSMGMGPYSSHQPSPIGTPLSPLASEFTSTSGSGPWKNEVSYWHMSGEGQTYLPTTEPLNYRRLLDRNVNCNWKYIVDKIVCNNDQQASIFLQQKLKVGTPDQKYEIVEAIVLQAHPLMVNRFGNFLVQRCFEHGTPEQVIKIAKAIRGNTLSLSMDPFGCHVVQKAFDSVPEDYKAIMVHELLRRIPETVIHRYACHVWQKLFELRWTESPPQIMKYVNEALRGMWHEVALGETGSLVVQNIFENCLEEDKRPCIEEVLANIDIVAHGQFGNWCIQHVCEHGAPADRSRAIDHVIRFAAEYSMDQYASKVVKKCLKIGGGEFLGRYLDRVCEGRMDRPRIPLINIASDQYGNYLIQWILNNANPQHREVVAAHIRKHTVSLRGSKFGSKVGLLCTNPAVATRPGPAIGTHMGRLPAGPRYGRSYQ